MPVCPTKYHMSDVDPFSDAFLSDPYPYHEALREAGPVIRIERYGIWGMARHDEVVATLTNWEAFCSSAGVGLSDFRKEKPWREPSIVLEADPPLQTRTHRVLARVMSPAALRALRAPLERAAEELVEHLVAYEFVDGIADIARTFPLKVFPDAVGCRPEGREHLLAYSDIAFNAFGPRNDRLVAAMTNAEPVVASIAAMCRREALSSEGIGAAIYRAVETDEVSEDEAGMLVRSLLTAGLDTTINAIGSALFCFARDPDQWVRLREDPALVRQAFDEAIRLESPVQTFFRTTTREVEVSGVRIGAGEKVLTFLGAANRDPRRWDEPDRFDIERRSGGHVGFGAGIHRCVGEMLSRLEGEILLLVLARRVRSIAPAGEAVLRMNNTIRGFERLPIRIVPA